MLAALQAAGTDGFVSRLLHAASLTDYNTRLVVTGVVVLGAAAGVVGAFLSLRGQALVADPIGHATLPGLMVAYMVQVGAGGDGRSLPGLLLGGFLSALAGAATIWMLSRVRRITDDAAQGLVLTVFYGGGVALMGMAQQLPAGRLSGVAGFVEGKAAQMIEQDVWLIAALGLICVMTVLALAKELALVSFDPVYARARGYPVRRLDLALLAVTTLVMVAGLQAVGLVLVMAMLIIPPAAARAWTHAVGPLLLLSALFGGLGAAAGTLISAAAARLPTGPLIVLAGATLFALSLLFGSKRGVLTTRWLRGRVVAR